MIGDSLLAYAELGVYWWWMDGWVLTAGGGLEYGIGQALSIFAEAAWLIDEGNAFGILLKAGLNWHPGN